MGSTRYAHPDYILRTCHRQDEAHDGRYHRTVVTRKSDAALWFDSSADDVTCTSGPIVRDLGARVASGPTWGRWAAWTRGGRPWNSSLHPTGRRSRNWTAESLGSYAAPGLP